MTIPDGFASRVIRMLGQDGKAWLDSIVATVQLCESRWNFKLSEPFNLNFNFVAASTDGRFIVKICLPGPDCKFELKTLQHYHGRGLCRLIDFIEERNVLLLEALHPGHNILAASEDSAINATCSIIKPMREANLEMLNAFPTISEWAEGITRIRSHFDKNSNPFNSQVLDRVACILEQLISTQRRVYLLHGDLHHENILSDGNHWKAIDPKGVVGEAEFEIIPFLLNNVSIELLESRTDYRIESFSQGLELNIDRIYGWGLVRSVLAAWWNIEDNLGISELDLRFINFFDKKAKVSVD